MIRRLIEAIAAAMVIGFTVAGFLGARAYLWEMSDQIGVALESGMIVGVIGALVPGLGYVLFGARVFGWVRADGFSTAFGALIGIALYGGYNAVSPLLPSLNNVPPETRALMGGIDGALLGALAGMIVGYLSGGTVEFTRAGILRYVMLFCLTLGVFAFAIVFASLSSITGLAALPLLLPVFFALRLMVRTFDARMSGQIPMDAYAEPSYYGYEEAAEDDTPMPSKRKKTTKSKG